MNKKNRIILILAWSLLIFLLLSLPIDVNTRQTYLKNADKIFHTFIFGLLAIFIYYLFNYYIIRGRAGIIEVLFADFLICFTIIYLGEFMQIFIPYRTASLGDGIAGIVGVVIGLIAADLIFRYGKHRLLLQICCAGCGIYAAQELRKKYRVILFFYNPNIYPKEEYDKRLAETKKIAKQFKLKLVEEGYAHENWLKEARGLEIEPEGGQRCLKCYRNRLEKTALEAKKVGVTYFTTTLTLSPHKDSEAINKIGQEVGKEHDLIYVAEYFDKNDCYQKSCELSKKYNLYRQNYCGCEFSVKNREKLPKGGALI